MEKRFERKSTTESDKSTSKDDNKKPRRGIKQGSEHWLALHQKSDFGNKDKGRKMKSFDSSVHLGIPYGIAHALKEYGSFRSLTKSSSDKSKELPSKRVYDKRMARTFSDAMHTELGFGAPLSSEVQSDTSALKSKPDSEA